MTIATSIHTVAIPYTVGPTTGTNPNTRSPPGAAANPIVLSSSPTSACVCGSGVRYTPIAYVSAAQNTQRSSASTTRVRTGASYTPELNPIPAAALESTTTTRACTV